VQPDVDLFVNGEARGSNGVSTAITVQVLNPSGRVVASQVVTPNAEGFWTVKFVLTEEQIADGGSISAFFTDPNSGAVVANDAIFIGFTQSAG
jgi:uncharacterized protein YfaS (alpha-2-macroglobulin family)